MDLVTWRDCLILSAGNSLSYVFSPMRFLGKELSYANLKSSVFVCSLK